MPTADNLEPDADFARDVTARYNHLVAGGTPRYQAMRVVKPSPSAVTISVQLAHMPFSKVSAVLDGYDADQLLDLLRACTGHPFEDAIERAWQIRTGSLKPAAPPAAVPPRLDHPHLREGGIDPTTYLSHEAIARRTELHVEEIRIRERRSRDVGSPARNARRSQKAKDRDVARLAAIDEERRSFDNPAAREAYLIKHPIGVDQP